MDSLISETKTFNMHNIHYGMQGVNSGYIHEVWIFCTWHVCLEKKETHHLKKHGEPQKQRRPDQGEVAKG